jgi:hypothetical protein
VACGQACGGKEHSPGGVDAGFDRSDTPPFQGNDVGGVDHSGGGPCSVVGVTFDVSRSRFAFGSTPVREDSASITRYVGTEGVVAVFACGAEQGTMNAGAPEAALPDWSNDTVALAAHTRDYFVNMGMFVCQIGSTDVQPALGRGAGAQVTIALTRAVDGIAVSESNAFARFNANDQTTSEGLFWPTLPADTLAAARALRDQLADPGTLAAYKAKLPASAQGTGRVVIHHTSGSGTCSG